MRTSKVYPTPIHVDLSHYGIEHPGGVYANLSTAGLYEEVLRRREGRLALGGAVVVRTGQHTGRLPKDKFVVRESSSEANIWWGEVNRSIEEDVFDRLYERVLAYLEGKDLFV